MLQPLPKSLLNIIETLNEDQLHTLYQVVAERLNLMHTARAMYAMKDFHTLEKVYFYHNGQRIEGTVTRLNQKTISVSTNDGGHWKVSPSFLTKTDN